MQNAPLTAMDQQSRFKKLKPLGIGLLVGALVSLILSTNLGKSIRSQLELEVGSQLRNHADRAVSLAPSIKVLAFDDRTAHSLDRKELKLSEWQSLLEAVAARKPKTIIVDHDFQKSPDPMDAAVFIFAMKTLNAPLFAAADLYPTGTLLGSPIDLDREEFRLERYSALSDLPPSLAKESQELLPYGPSVDLQDAFTGLGRRNVSDGLLIKPLVRIQNERVVPHWGLLAHRVQVQRERLLIDGKPAPLNDRGQLMIQQLAAREILNATTNLAYTFERIANDEPLEFLSEGDTVIILPRLFTGHGEWSQTPQGRVPSAFLRVSLINSAITGNWVRPGSGHLTTTLLAGVVAAYLAYLLPTAWFFGGMIGMLAFWILGATSMFAATGWLVPWLGQALAITASGLIQHSVTQREVRGRADLIRQDLQGVIAREKLQQGSDRELMRLEATEQVVSIMFIDIVGFSRAAERQTPKEAFTSLKSLIDTLRETVTEYGGSVDRTMGDGMLCVFGYNTTTKSDSRMHADRAIKCAEAIQRENIKRIQAAKKTGQAVFPLRIGINTTGVYIGNLGDAETTDFTVIGNGVNFANRLESACDRHMVMVGASTRDLVFEAEYFLPRLRKRFIRIKHHDELVEAYEFDPFFEDEKTLVEGDEAYREYMGTERADTRWPVPDAGLVRAMTDQGDGELVNFSLGGFTLKLPGYFAKGVIINLEMDTIDGSLGDRLESLGLKQFVIEVRWARPGGDGYIHGCEIKNLNEEQCEDIVNALRECLQQNRRLDDVQLVS